PACDATASSRVAQPSRCRRLLLAALFPVFQRAATSIRNATDSVRLRARYAPDAAAADAALLFFAFFFEALVPDASAGALAAAMGAEAAAASDAAALLFFFDFDDFAADACS